MLNRIPSNEGPIGWKCNLDITEKCNCKCITFNPREEDICVCKHFELVLDGRKGKKVAEGCCFNCEKIFERGETYGLHKGKKVCSRCAAFIPTEEE